MAILVIAEHDNTTLSASTGTTLTAAARCGSEIDVLVMGYECDRIAQQAAGMAGVRRVLQADALSLQHRLAETAAEQVLSVADEYSHILAPATAFGKAVLPRVAARLGVSPIADISRVISPDTFERAIYAGNAIATVQSTAPIKVLTVRMSAFEQAGSGGNAAIVPVAAVEDTGRAVFIATHVDKSDRPELATARIIVAGGQGVGSAARFRLVEELADKLSAAVGASRAVVDAGWAKNDLQIGQTGKIVAPELYIAVGISGAIQHVAGMKNAKTIVAINQDPDAPIFGVADYGLVGDAEVILPELIAALG